MNSLPRSLRWAGLLTTSAVLLIPAFAAAQKQPGAERLSREELLAKFDANGDGVLDETEREAARAAMRGTAERPARGERPDRGARAETPANPEEAAARRAASRARLEARFDANGDGVLDATERAALEQYQAERRAQRAANPAATAPAAAGQRPDRNARQARPEATPADPAAREARRAEMLKRFDANGDGTLDDDERATMRAALQAERGNNPGGPGARTPRAPRAPQP